MRFDIVVNPNGASGRTGRAFRKLIPVVRESGQEVHIHFSTKEHGIETIVRDLCQAGPAAGEEMLNLVIVGGDGTWNEAVNGIVDFDRVRLGYIPSGSGNDFAKALALPKDRAVLLKQILTGKVCRRLDVGEAAFCNMIPAEEVDRQTRTAEQNEQHEEGGGDQGRIPGGQERIPGDQGRIPGGQERIPGDQDRNGHPQGKGPGSQASSAQPALIRRFNVSCGMGFDAAICHAAAVSPLKGGLNRLHLGKLIYILCAIRLIFTTRKHKVKVTQTGEAGEKVDQYPSTLFALAMNTKYEGGGFAFCPKARDDDGILDVCMGVTRHNAMFFVAFPFIYGGHHTKIPVFYISQTKSVRFQSQEPLWVHTDGEVHYQSTDISIRLLPGKLQFLE